MTLALRSAASHHLLMIYQHPLAYLLGLEGVALLHAFAGGYDRDFTEARLAEVRALLDSADQLGGGAAIRPIPTLGPETTGRAAPYRRGIVRGG